MLNPHLFMLNSLFFVACPGQIAPQTGTEDGVAWAIDLVAGLERPMGCNWGLSKPWDDHEESMGKWRFIW